MHIPCPELMQICHNHPVKVIIESVEKSQRQKEDYVYENKATIPLLIRGVK